MILTKEEKKIIRSFEDSRWLVKEFEHLKTKYPNMFVAVLDQQVVASHENISELMKVVDEKFPEAKTFISTEYIGEKKKEFLIL
jgi:hypothetical protein